jgi:AcrR family transcriptional regulator
VNGRPRQNTDVEIPQAAFRAIARLGPTRLTLADVAEEAGVTPAALVQRFGSKRALLLAAAADAAGGRVYIFQGLREKHRSPYAALLGLSDCMGVMGCGTRPRRASCAGAMPSVSPARCTPP